MCSSAKHPFARVRVRVQSNLAAAQKWWWLSELHHRSLNTLLSCVLLFFLNILLICQGCS